MIHLSHVALVPSATVDLPHSLTTVLVRRLLVKQLLHHVIAKLQNDISSQSCAFAMPRSHVDVELLFRALNQL